MSSPRWNDDHELLQELRVALQEEPVDERVIQTGLEAFTWRLDDPEIELLILADGYRLEAGRDPGAGLPASAHVRGRGAGGPQTLVFHGERMSVEIEIDETGIVGQLMPPHPGQVTLMTANGPQATTQADELGCFSLPAPGSGPLRLDCQLADCRFITDWATA